MADDLERKDKFKIHHDIMKKLYGPRYARAQERIKEYHLRAKWENEGKNNAI